MTRPRTPSRPVEADALCEAAAHSVWRVLITLSEAPRSETYEDRDLDERVVYARARNAVSLARKAGSLYRASGYANPKHAAETLIGVTLSRLRYRY